MLTGVTELRISSQNKLFIPDLYQKYLESSCIVIAEDASLNCPLLSIIKDDSDAIRWYYFFNALDGNFDRSQQMFVRFSIINGAIKFPDFIVKKLGYEVVLVGIGDQLELYSKSHWQITSMEIMGAVLDLK